MRNKETDNECSEDVEEQNTYTGGLERYIMGDQQVLTDVNALDRSGEVASWILGLGCSDCDNFCADEGKRCLGHDSPPP